MRQTTTNNHILSKIYIQIRSHEIPRITATTHFMKIVKERTQLAHVERRR